MYCQSYCRSRLGETMKHIRTIVSAEDIKQAWVWKTASYNGNHVEFHGPNGFHWSDDGCCLWSARSDGWEAYLQHLEYRLEDQDTLLKQEQGSWAEYSDNLNLEG